MTKTEIMTVDLNLVFQTYVSHQVNKIYVYHSCQCLAQVQ